MGSVFFAVISLIPKMKKYILKNMLKRLFFWFILLFL